MMIVKERTYGYFFNFLASVIVVFIFSSCAGRGNTVYFSQRMKSFSPTSYSEIIIYEDIPQDQFLRIGYVDTPPFDGEPGERQQRIIQRAAARMGAHAIYELRQLDSHHYSYAGDPHTPFPSFMNVRKERTILRATAIRFLEENQESGK